MLVVIAARRRRRRGPDRQRLALRALGRGGLRRPSSAAKAVAGRIRTGTIARQRRRLVRAGLPRSAATSSPASAARWAWPASRSTSRPRPGRAGLSHAPATVSIRRGLDTLPIQARGTSMGRSRTRSRSSPARRRASVRPTRRRWPPRGPRSWSPTSTTSRRARSSRQIEADGGRAVFVRTDVSSADSAIAMAEATVAAFGGIDYLVNNAAIYGDMEFDLLVTSTGTTTSKFMSVNMDGALRRDPRGLSRTCRRGGGAIVNQSLDGGLAVLRLLRPGQGRHQRPDPAARPRARRA